MSEFNTEQGDGSMSAAEAAHIAAEYDQWEMERAASNLGPQVVRLNAGAPAPWESTGGIFASLARPIATPNLDRLHRALVAGADESEAA